MNKIILWFTKITGAPVSWFYFKKKIYYVNKKKQSRKIKGGAIIVSNHTSVYDYALYLFVFFGRTLRTLMAELLFEKNKLLTWFLYKMGGIRVDRNNYDFNFVGPLIDIVDKGGVALVFPEARIPKPEESVPLPFKPSFVYIALETGAPIIPVYTNGMYNQKKKRAKVLIGEPIDLSAILGTQEVNKESIDYLTNYVRNQIISLGEQLNAKEKEGSKKSSFTN